jgi:hypothetical protein
VTDLDDFFDGDPFSPPPCKRCGGEGTVTYEYGKPGPDMHLPWSEVIKDGPPHTRTCPVCRGSGEGRFERKRPPMHIHFGDPITRTPLARRQDGQDDD